MSDPTPPPTDDKLLERANAFLLALTKDKSVIEADMIIQSLLDKIDGLSSDLSAWNTRAALRPSEPPRPTVKPFTHEEGERLSKLPADEQFAVMLTHGLKPSPDDAAVLDELLDYVDAWQSDGSQAAADGIKRTRAAVLAALTERAVIEVCARVADKLAYASPLPSIEQAARIAAAIRALADKETQSNG